MNYKQLEKQLGNLQKELGFRFCVIVGHLHEGYNLGVYDADGDLLYQVTDASILQCKIKFKDWYREVILKAQQKR